MFLVVLELFSPLKPSFPPPHSFSSSIILISRENKRFIVLRCALNFEWCGFLVPTVAYCFRMQTETKHFFLDWKMWRWNCSWWRYWEGGVCYWICWRKWVCFLVLHSSRVRGFLSCFQISNVLWGCPDGKVISKWGFYFSIDAVIDDKTCEERLWDMKRRGETNFYLCEINRDMVIDATYKGNKSRYINHSCSPNTEMQKWFLLLSVSSLLTNMHYFCPCLTWLMFLSCKDNRWWNKNWHICNSRHHKGRASDLWLSVWTSPIPSSCTTTSMIRVL